MQEEGLNGQGESEEVQRTMDYVYSDELDLNRFTGGRTGNVDGADENSESYRVQTKTLYGIAKGFLEEMKQMGQRMS